ncbi:MAK10-like protein [Tanacetum coccineum]
MGDENHIRTLRDYSKPSHEGYTNTIELPVGNNVIPLRSDIILLVQNGCSFYGLRSKDPNQHLNDLLKLADSLELNARSITTWEDLTTRFLAQFFPPGRTAKLRNDILMFQQHHGESLSEVWTYFKDLLQKVPHHGIDLWLQVPIFYDHVNPVIRRTIDQSAGSKLHDRNAKESWALLEDLALYDNESWNDPRDFAKPVKAITLPQDDPSTSDRRLIELENQVQRLTEAHIAPTQPTQMNKITTSYEAGEGLVSNFMASQDARHSKFEADFKQQQSKMTNKIDTVLKAITDRIAGALPSDTVKNPKLSASLVLSAQKENEEEEKDNPENIHVNPSTPPDPSVAFITKKVLKFNSFFESLRLVPQSFDTEVIFTKGGDGEVMFIELIRKNDDSSEGEPEEEGSTITEGVGV